MEKDQEFLEFIVKTIVDHPEAVTIERKVDEMGVLLLLKVHAEDMGQVVGRQGATAKAIRTLLRIVGIKANARVNLKIEEPEGSTFVRSPRPEAVVQEKPVTESAPVVEAKSAEQSLDDDLDAIADEIRL
jgi:uncharacterized protein